MELTHETEQQISQLPCPQPLLLLFSDERTQVLQKVVGKKELRYSLKTGNLTDAKYKARILAGQVQRLFQHLRKRGQVLLTKRTYRVQFFILDNKT